MPVPLFITEEIERRRRAGLLRQLRTVSGPQGPWVEVNGARVLMLCSNNYLGLADHPEIVEAARRSAIDDGFGSGASRLISGSMSQHQRLEDELADFKSTARALLFNSGYHANIGAISALVAGDDEVFSDELNHASLIDGCRLSRARVSVYRHCDLTQLADLLKRSRARRKLIVSDSVFSMDGDVAPLRELCALAEEHGALTLIDEAHATGVVGPQGAGVVSALGLTQQVTVQMGTLGKALGTFGAFVCGESAVVELLINAARSFVFTTALPPPVVAAARAALAIARRADDRRAQLRRNGTQLAHGLLAAGYDLPITASGPASAVDARHILPVVIGDPQRTMTLSEQLLTAGVFVQGIRPPTVPAGTSRLRVTLMSSHQPADLDLALAAFAELAHQPERQHG